MTISALSSAEIRRTEALTGLQRSVLFAVLYADLFDFPLSEDELQKRLVLRRADLQTLRQCVRSLTGRYLTTTGRYIVWKGREHLVDLRRHRTAASEELWKSAVRYAAWLARIPFMRMVAVSGSLAADNADRHSDVDLFCITEVDRLWMVRLFIVVLSKMTRLFPRIFPRYLCPNYILTCDALEVTSRNLYTAHEVAQARPLFGTDVHADFLRANRWVDGFLPGTSALPNVRIQRRPSVATRLLESVFEGRVGDWIDAAVYRVFRTFYRRRALRRGWSWRRLEAAYQRNRYTVPENGYVPVVRRLFIEGIVSRLGSSYCADDVRRLFPEEYAASGESCWDWEGQFRRDYGERREEVMTSALKSEGDFLPVREPPFKSAAPT